MVRKFSSLKDLYATLFFALSSGPHIGAYCSTVKKEEV